MFLVSVCMAALAIVSSLFIRFPECSGFHKQRYVIRQLHVSIRVSVNSMLRRTHVVRVFKRLDSASDAIRMNPSGE